MFFALPYEKIKKIDFMGTLTRWETDVKVKQVFQSEWFDIHHSYHKLVIKISFDKKDHYPPGNKKPG